MNISAVIIGRKGSKRIPSKMWQKINNFSLIEYKIRQLSKSKIKKIYVGSDDKKIETICKKYKKTVFILREKKFCDEKSTTPNAMVKNMLQHIDTDYILWAHPTNPLINESVYNKAIKLYFSKNQYKSLSLFSATKIKDHFWHNKKEPLNYNLKKKTHTLAKDLKPVYRQNGGIFIRKTSEMKKDGLFVGKKPLMFEMDEISGWDINYNWELKVAKYLINLKKNKLLY